MRRYYTRDEMQVYTIAKLLKDEQIVIVGTGLPILGAVLAKKKYTPNCHLIAESGLMDCNPPEVPRSVADLRFMNHCGVQWHNTRFMGLEVNEYLKGTNRVIAFIGGAQVDQYGNVNSTCIGDYHRPKARFSGSGGANGIATVNNTIIMMKHSKRKFVEKVDYITSPGWIDGKDGRKNTNLPPEVGPRIVISDLGIMKFDEETKKMYIYGYYPYSSVEEIKENTSFEIYGSGAIEMEEPSKEIIKYIREEVDPFEIFNKYSEASL